MKHIASNYSRCESTFSNGLLRIGHLELFHALLNKQVGAFVIVAGNLDPLAHFLQSFLQNTFTKLA